MKNGKIVDCHTAGAMISQENIILRYGGLCAYPLMNRLGVDGTIRASFYLYNDYDDIKNLCSAIEKIIKLII